jgi:hypothetical protein
MYTHTHLCMDVHVYRYNLRVFSVQGHCDQLPAASHTFSFSVQQCQSVAYPQSRVRFASGQYDASMMLLVDEMIIGSSVAGGEIHFISVPSAPSSAYTCIFQFCWLYCDTCSCACIINVLSSQLLLLLYAYLSFVVKSYTCIRLF